jgi:hypothetical protein
MLQNQNHQQLITDLKELVDKTKYQVAVSNGGFVLENRTKNK